MVRRLAGDGCLHVQQRLVAPAYLLHVTAISEPDCSPLLILCTAQSGPKNLKLFLLKTNHLRMLKALKAPGASIHQTQCHGHRIGPARPHPGASYLPGTSLHLQRWHQRTKLKGDSSKQLREKPRKVQGSQPSATPEGDGASPSNFAGRFSSQLKPRCELLLDIGRWARPAIWLVVSMANGKIWKGWVPAHLLGMEKNNG